MKKTAIVTGASGGIGAAVAEILASDHAIIAAYHTNKAAAERLAARLTDAGHEVVCFAADITDPAQATALTDFATARFGGVDVLVNCAGKSLLALVTDTTDAQYREIMDVNMTGVFCACRAVLPRMIAQKSGVIVNVSSMWGQTGASCETVYSAAKAAVIGFTKALAKEVGPSGVTVNCVAPGLIDTGMNDALSRAELDAFAAGTPLGRMGTCADVARAVRYLVDDRFTTGQVLSPNGGATV